MSCAARPRDAQHRPDSWARETASGDGWRRVPAGRWGSASLMPPRPAHRRFGRRLRLKLEMGEDLLGHWTLQDGCDDLDLTRKPPFGSDRSWPDAGVEVARTHDGCGTHSRHPRPNRRPQAADRSATDLRWVPVVSPLRAVVAFTGSPAEIVFAKGGGWPPLAIHRRALRPMRGNPASRSRAACPTERRSRQPSRQRRSPRVACSRRSQARRSRWTCAVTPSSVPSRGGSAPPVAPRRSPHRPSARPGRRRPPASGGPCAPGRAAARRAAAIRPPAAACRRR